MQEEAIPISEEEASDSEIVMISHHRQSMQQQSDEQSADRHLRSQEKVIDSQLKALGLFEEGLSFEQKEELLAVVAASRETAEHEESMRVQAKEWQQKVFPNSEFETVVQLTELNESSSSPAQVDDSIQHLSVDEDECSTSGVSRDVYEASEIDDPPSKDSEDPCGTADQNFEALEVRSKRIGYRRGRFRRGGRGRGQTGSLKVSPPSSLAVDLEAYEPGSSQNQQVDHKKQRKDLEKFISDWKPCLSPETLPLVDKRLKEHQESEVPYEETEEDDAYKNLCDSLDQYHISLNKFQRTATVYIPWGQPLTVGRAYATRSSRGRVSDMESADGVFSYQSQGVSDSMFLVENADGDKYIQLQQYEKLFYQGLDSSGMNSTRTVSPFPVVTVLSTADAESTSLTKRTRYSTRGESSSTSTDKTVVSKEETIVDVETVVSSSSTTSPRSGSSGKRGAVVRSDSGDPVEDSVQKASGSGSRSKGYFSSETVTRIEDASSDSSVDIESFDAEIPVCKDDSKRYSSKEKQSATEDPAVLEEEMQETAAKENSPPDPVEASSQSQQDSKADSCSSVKRKRTTATSSSTKVNTSPSKRWKESGMA